MKKSRSHATNLMSHELTAITHYSIGIVQTEKDFQTRLEWVNKLVPTI